MANAVQLDEDVEFVLAAHKAFPQLARTTDSYWCRPEEKLWPISSRSLTTWSRVSTFNPSEMGVISSFPVADKSGRSP